MIGVRKNKSGGIRVDTRNSRPAASQDLVGRTEQELHALEDELYAKYCEVGKAVLETAEMEGEKINNLVDRIVETKKRLLELRREKICTACLTGNDQNNRYCSRCGKKFEECREETTK